MRRWSGLALSCLAVAGCGGADDQAGKERARGGGELTVTLPPTLPTEPALTEPAPQAGFETIAAAEPEVKAAPEAPKAAPRPKQPEPDAGPPEVEVALAPTPAAAPPGEGEAAAAEAAAPAATPPAGAGAWAGYLRRAGFPCRRVATANPVERAANPGFRYYKVDCEGGASYQATNKRGHLYFRRWRG